VSEKREETKPVIKWGSQVLISREMLGLPPLEPVPMPSRPRRVFYWLRRRWWEIKRIPGYRLVHKDDMPEY
jgi:hypothetical protein